MSHSNRSRGRPRQAEKTQHILDAIGYIVCEEGLAALTMEGVARIARVSKTTLYRRYSSREELITHYVSFLTQEVIGQELTPDNLPLEPKARLVAVGVGLMGFLTREDIIRFDNAIAAAAPQFPEAARAFAQASLNKAEEIVRNALLDAQSTGLYQSEDLDDDVSALIGLWSGGLYERVRFEGNADWPLERITRHIERRTHRFLAMTR